MLASGLLIKEQALGKAPRVQRFVSHLVSSPESTVKKLGHPALQVEALQRMGQDNSKRMQGSLDPSQLNSVFKCAFIRSY